MCWIKTSRRLEKTQGVVEARGCGGGRNMGDGGMIEECHSIACGCIIVVFLGKGMGLGG